MAPTSTAAGSPRIRSGNVLKYATSVFSSSRLLLFLGLGEVLSSSLLLLLVDQDLAGGFNCVSLELEGSLGPLLLLFKKPVEEEGGVNADEQEGMYNDFA